GQRGAIEMKGGPVDHAAADRFESVVRTIVDGIEDGLFPARPGEDDWRPGTGPTHSNCYFCEFDHLCATTRGEQWLNIRTRDELAKAGSNDRLPADEQARSAAARAQIDRATITTLHGFAQRILAEHPLDVGLAPVFEIDDEVRARVRFVERWTQFRDELF